ncbi:phytanoyl-CoA dioxygenase family protein [Armatimonas sp.]|uniref:phytanoyl-CoA dioxygenase family protein n=1 Tax=Armatimonas sp. TaxID=1872638 RepID=UPI003752453E
MESAKPPALGYVPDPDDLTTLERDLRFHPALTQHPQLLTPDQLAHYNEHGYIRPVLIFDDSEIAALRSRFDEILAQTLASGGSSYSIATAHRKYGFVYDLLKHPKIIAAVCDILGPDVIGWGAHFFCKMPHDGKKVDWHQDAVFWPLTPSKTVTVWLAIDDADPENANMRFIPGSHRHGPVMHLPTSAAEDNVLNLKIENAERFGDAPVDDTLKAGEASLHSDLLLHGSEPNTSDRRRCGLTLRYCAAEVKAHLGWDDKGILVAGEDREGNWKNAARPTSPHGDSAVTPFA